MSFSWPGLLILQLLHHAHVVGPLGVDGGYRCTMVREKIKRCHLAREGLRERTNAISSIFGEADGLPGLSWINIRMLGYSIPIGWC